MQTGQCHWHSLLPFSLALPSCLAPFQLAPGPLSVLNSTGDSTCIYLIITWTSPISGNLPALSSQGSTSRSCSLTKSIAIAFSTHSYLFWPMMKYRCFFHYKGRRMVRHWTGFPIPGSSRPRLWATCSSGRGPCLCQGAGTRTISRSLPTRTILWFCDTFLVNTGRGDKTPQFMQVVWNVSFFYWL